MNKKIVRYLLKCGIKPHHLGFKYMQCAIEKTIKNGNVLPKVTKQLYPAIAEEFDTTSSKVERALRHTVTVAGDRKYRPMSSSEFIALAAVQISVLKEGD